MIADVKKIVSVCAKLDITIEEFFFLYMVHVADWESLTIYLDVKGFQSEVERLESVKLLTDINVYDSPKSFDEKGKKIIKPSKLLVSNEFLSELFISADDAWNEFISVFPYEFTNSTGTRYNARTLPTEVGRQRYNKIIKNDVEVHNRIVELTKKARDLNWITVGLDKYLDHEMWNGIEARLNTENPTEGGYGDNML